MSTAPCWSVSTPRPMRGHSAHRIRQPCGCDSAHEKEIVARLCREQTFKHKCYKLIAANYINFHPVLILLKRVKMATRSAEMRGILTFFGLRRIYSTKRLLYTATVA